MPTADLAPGEALDMHSHINRNLIDLRELQELLHRQHAALAFHLAIYEEGARQAALADIVTALYRPVGGQPPCSQHCLQQWEDLVNLAMVSNRPQLHSCAHGLIGFAIPLPGDPEQAGLASSAAAFANGRRLPPATPRHSPPPPVPRPGESSSRSCSSCRSCSISSYRSSA
ncbi:MAG: PocR ligand-binding domain-containing protein [Desulfomicrobium escambiense]|nr:PocR ligand-binding domain-containing protein [Desulfomicrobium escambiense]